MPRAAKKSKPAKTAAKKYAVASVRGNLGAPKTKPPTPARKTRKPAV
jgi:hypothetical protein